MSKFDASKDYYKSLNLSRTATKADIKKAFRQLAKKYHPDNNKGNEEKFKEINEAYQILSSETTRKDYDDAKTHPQQPYNSKQQRNYNYNHNPNQQTYQSYHNRQYPYYKQHNTSEGWTDFHERQRIIRQMFMKQQQNFNQQAYQKHQNPHNRKDQNYNNYYQYNQQNMNDDLWKMFQQRSNIRSQDIKKKQRQYQQKRQAAWEEQRIKEGLQFQAFKDKKQEEFFKAIHSSIQGFISINDYIKDVISKVANKEKIVNLFNRLWNIIKRK